MYVRRYLIVLLILSGAAIPAILGASCPAPTAPQSLTMSLTRSTDLAPPPCDQGFVCISLVNTTIITVEVALYTHDGFDLRQIYDCGTAPDCCPENNAQRSCKCWCPGAQVGELCLTPPELFNPTRVNLTPIFGMPTTSLGPGMSKVVSIQCEKIKSMGIDVGRPGQALTSPEHRAGVNYRCSMLPGGAPPSDCLTGRTGAYLARCACYYASDVPCGGTIEYRIYDRNNGVNPNFVSLAVVNPPKTTAPCPYLAPTTP